MTVAVPFAAQAAQCNRDAIEHLADKVLVNGGVETAVVFSEVEFSTERNPMEPRRGKEWCAGAPFADFGLMPPREGNQVEIGGVDYVIGRGPMVDPSGWATYILNRK